MSLTPTNNNSVTVTTTDTINTTITPLPEEHIKTDNLYHDHSNVKENSLVKKNGFNIVKINSKSYRNVHQHNTPLGTVPTKSIDISGLQNTNRKSCASTGSNVSNTPSVITTVATESNDKLANDANKKIITTITTNSSTKTINIKTINNTANTLTTTTTTTNNNSNTTANAQIKQTSSQIASSNATNIMILKISKVLLQTDLDHKRRSYQHYVTFLHDVLKRSKTTKTCLILATFYYNKLDKYLNIKLAENVEEQVVVGKDKHMKDIFKIEYCAKRRFYGCLILAHKYLNDKTFNMESWSIISGQGGLLKSDIGKIEKWCLGNLNYELYVKDLNVLQTWCLDELLYV